MTGFENVGRRKGRSLREPGQTISASYKAKAS